MVSIISVFAFSLSARAAESMEKGERVLLGKDEIVNRDYFAAGESVTIEGVVNGDAYVAGNTVTVTGTVNGDVLVAARYVDVRGIVTGDIRGAGERVVISGKVGGNLTLAGSSVEISSSALIPGGIVAGAGEMTVSAPIGKGITAGVGTLRIDKSVGGDLTYWSEHDLALGTDATVSGTVVRHDIPKQEKKERAAAGAVAGAIAGVKFLEMIGFLIMGALVIKLMPHYTASVIEQTRAKPWLSLFVGFCFTIIAPVSVIILLATLIGIPLAFVVLLSFILICVFAKIFAALFVGKAVLSVFSKKPNMYGSLFVGIIVFFVLMVIPFLGWIAIAVLYLMSLGGLLLQKKQLYKSMTDKKIV